MSLCSAVGIPNSAYNEIYLEKLKNETEHKNCLNIRVEKIGKILIIKEIE
ncbi:hypothetical protein [Borreliella mayonii]|nr:hypothetical protein [Borreliella mayonii]